MGQYTKNGLLNGYKKNNKEREELDYYATPSCEVYNILATLGYDLSGKRILEPCIGGGHMVAGIQKYINLHKEGPSKIPAKLAVEGIVKAGQYLVMYLWSYAEGLTEVKALLSGWKVLPFKNKETWHLSFEDFISLNFNPEEEKCEKGLKYEMYLRALLMFKDEGEKSAYTMDLVELWKIAKGDIKFRLRNYVFAIEAEIMYSVSGFNRKYNYLVAESY